MRSHTNAEKPDNDVVITLSEPVSLTFSLKYLVNFCKASGLSGKVKLCLSSEVPLLVEYSLSGTSFLRFYLAPKVSEMAKLEVCFALTGSRLAMMSRAILNQKRIRIFYVKKSWPTVKYWSGM